VTLLLGVSPLILSASHIIGGEITWRCDGNGQFIFQLKLYRDCNGVSGPGSITLITNAPIGSINCPLISQNDISPQGIGCPTCPNPIGIANAIEENIYESSPIFLVGTPPPTGWYFYRDDCCRNGAITNLSNTGDFTHRAYIFPISGQNTSPCFDSSPHFAEPPTIAICTRDSVNLSFAAFDNDLDSLVYAFAPPIENGFPGNNVGYNSGYTYSAPLPKPQHNPLNVPAILNTASGQLSLTSYTQGLFVVVMEVSSYRCGAIISKVYREFQLAIVSNCILSITPTISYNTSPDIFPLPHSETINITVGDTLNYNFYATENELLPAAMGGNSQTITMNATSVAMGLGDTSYTLGCEIPPCAILSSPTPVSSTLNLSQGLIWPTECHHLEFNDGCLQHTRDYQFIFTIKDDYCPVPGVTTKSLLVKVTGPTIYSAGNSLAVSFPGITVQWYLNGTLIIGATDTLYTPTQSGTYSMIATTSNGCTLISNSMYIGFAGVDDIKDHESKFEVFPNPSAGNHILNVLLQNAKTGPNEIQIIDITGKLVKQIPIYVSTTNEHLLIDLGGLANGVYTINISGDGKIHQTQLLLTN
jgi:hypothetical protein